jgi:hypothetical protein
MGESNQSMGWSLHPFADVVKQLGCRPKGILSRQFFLIDSSGAASLPATVESSKPGLIAFRNNKV